MTKSTDTQIRGICQCCGREQAVVNGTMSKHGYTVQHGWFSGVCTGQHYAPMQISRDHADATVAAVREECVKLRQHIADLKVGKATPLTAKSGNKIKEAGVASWNWKDETVPFAEAQPHYQREAVQTAIWNAERRVQIGESFANDLEALADRYHGKDLTVVTKAQAPERIQPGEQRKTDGGALVTVSHVEGARVYWKNERGFKGWTGTQAFRRFAKV